MEIANTSSNIFLLSFDNVHSILFRISQSISAAIMAAAMVARLRFLASICCPEIFCENVD